MLSAQTIPFGYGTCLLAISGGSPAGPMMTTWATDNASPDTVRAVIAVIIPGIGQLGAIISVWAYLCSDAPNYHHGNRLNIITCSIGAILIATQILYIYWKSERRDRGERNHRLLGATSRLSVSALNGSILDTRQIHHCKC